MTAVCQLLPHDSDGAYGDLLASSRTAKGDKLCFVDLERDRHGEGGCERKELRSVNAVVASDDKQTEVQKRGTAWFVFIL